MTQKRSAPVLFFAFANDQDERAHYLRRLGEEARRIRSALEDMAVRHDLCELVIRQNATVDEVLDVFQEPKYRDRIAIFHFGGHANSYQLLLEDAQGKRAVADAGGLSAFLGLQKNLKLVFLNGCSTEPQVQGLLDANVPLVIATLGPIDDQMAADFAARFYQALGCGRNLGASYDEAVAALQTKAGGNPRHLYLSASPLAAAPTDRWPWIRRLHPGAEITLAWSLPEAASDPLFGLPPIPDQLWRKLPECPFRGLDWFTREDAPIFFGRGCEIRELYQQITAPRSLPLILFYGQSGVGKSSLLAAGLLPRLEQSHTICYQRRNQAIGLLGALQAALPEHGSGMTLAAAWAAIEARDGRPLLVILDQVEEVFTRPNSEQPHELAEFLKALSGIFTDTEHHPQGKLILSFRKEWLAEIKRQVLEQKLPHAEVFLQRLSDRGVVEGIEGPTRTPELQAKYRLAVEGRLPVVIADDLLADRESAVAPTLQILLTKMWKRAEQIRPNQPCFDHALYDELRQQGLGLDDVLAQQLAELEQHQPDVVQSGLALDVLAYHTTPLGTAAEHTREELRQNYQHRQEILEPLMHECVNLYLLVEPAKHALEKAPSSRLAHDTLAPLVRHRFDESDAPGQRARRILENRAVEWKEGQSGGRLDDQDLGLVEQGVMGMCSLTCDEKRLLEASLKQRRNRRFRRTVAWVSTVAVALAFVALLSLRFISALQRANEAHSLKLAIASQNAADIGDQDLAVALALEAYQGISAAKIQDNRAVKTIGSMAPGLARELAAIVPPETERALSLFYRTPGFTRSHLNGHRGSVTSLAFHPSDSHVAISSAQDGSVILWNLQRGAGQPLAWHTGTAYSLAFNVTGQQVIAGYEDGALVLGELETEDQWRVVGKVTAHNGAVTAVAFSPTGKQIVSGGADSTVKLWNLEYNPIENVWTLPDRSQWTFTDHTDEVTSVLFSPTEPAIVSGSGDGFIYLIDAANGTRIGEGLFGDNGGIVGLAISSDGKRIFAGAGRYGYGGNRSCLWSLDTNKCLDFPPYGEEGHIDSVTGVAFSPNGRYMASASEDQSIILWNGSWNDDPAKRTILHRFSGHKQTVNRVAFSPDGRHILSGASDGSIRLWDIGAGAEIHRTHASKFALSPDGRSGLVVDGSELYRWDIEHRGAPIRIDIRSGYWPVEHTYVVTFSPDGERVLFGLKTGAICTLELATEASWCFEDRHPGWVRVVT